ncbi:MAG TPA: hypothetical protein DEB38_07500 [Acidimicrobiaceae bacterium]|nr:hypothetical protein [Acidimicrobiaceae bacterium]
MTSLRRRARSPIASLPREYSTASTFLLSTCCPRCGGCRRMLKSPSGAPRSDRND